jgi:hypothetical protein
LEEEAVVGIKQEDRECAVKETLINVGHQVAYCRAKWLNTGILKIEGGAPLPLQQQKSGVGIRVGMEPYRSSC